MAATAALIPALAASEPAQAPAGPSPAKNDGGTPVTIEEVTPKAVEAKSTVTISGQVTNTSERELPEVSVRLRYSGYPFTHRSQLDDYAAGDGVQPHAYGPRVEIDDPLSPGESASYEIKAKAEDLGLGGFGVYPMAVEARTGSGDALGHQRTFLPYQGESSPDPVRISWVWPLMGQPHRASDDLFLDDTLPESLSPTGRLGRLLSAGAQSDDVTLQPSPTPGAEEQPDGGEEQQKDEQKDTKGEQSPQPTQGDGGEEPTPPAEEAGDGSTVPLTWAVDPALLDDIHRLTAGPYRVVDEGYAPSSGKAPKSSRHEVDQDAVTWLGQARAVLRDEHVVATPYARPDIGALLDNGLRDDAEASIPEGRETVERILSRPADNDYALPAGGAMDTATRDFHAEQDAERFLLRDPAMPAQPWIGHTPTAAAPLPLKGDNGTALVADSGLTDVLSQPTGTPGETALAEQRFAAETAMISGEPVDGDRTIIAAPPADWNPGSDFATSVLQATQDLPWLKPVALDDVKANPDSEPERQDLTLPDQAAEARLDSGYLDEIKQVRGDVRLFNSILDDPDDPDPFRPAILRLESAAWRGAQDRAELARAVLGHAVTDSTHQVRIIPSEQVTLASRTGTIGIVIANDLPHPVEAYLSMYSENSDRLSIRSEPRRRIEIGPNQKTTVYVKLDARINGRTMLHQSLQNPEGEPISGETLTPINASGLGSQALLISAIGGLVLVITLAPRAVRKWARRRAAARGREDGTGPDPDSDPDDASEEPGATADDAETDAAGAPTADAADADDAPDVGGMPHNDSDSSSGSSEDAGGSPAADDDPTPGEPTDRS